MTAGFASFELSEPSLSPEGLRFVTVKSANLGGRADVTLWAPEGVTRFEAMVILLHGVYGSHWAWAFKAGAHRIAARAYEEGVVGPVLLAMPSDGLCGDGSGYLQHIGADYERWIMEDVPAIAREVYGAGASDAPLCLSGLSMGGFGALRLGARHSDKVAAVSAHSSATTGAELQAYIREPLPAELTDMDIAEVWSRTTSARPALRIDCGLDDPALAGNQRLHESLLAQGVAHVYEQRPGGHDWAYWSTALPHTLMFFQDVLRSRVA